MIVLAIKDSLLVSNSSPINIWPIFHYNNEIEISNCSQEGSVSKQTRTCYVAEFVVSYVKYIVFSILITNCLTPMKRSFAVYSLRQCYILEIVITNECTPFIAQNRLKQRSREL